MAHKLEEEFVINHLLPGDVFEFGGGDCSWANAIPAVQVYTVDLYPPSNLPPNVQYTQGNFLDITFTRCFTNAVCLSSLEHAGIETFHFKHKAVNLDEIQYVAKKLSNLVSPNGRLLITVPAGTNEIYGVVSDQEDRPYTPDSNFKWGYRTFTLDKLLALFPNFKLINAEAYLRKSYKIDYFLPENWERANPLNISNRYKEQNALLCVALEPK